MIEFLSDPGTFSAFESSYLKLRQKEGRVLSDEQLQQLPWIQGLSEQLDAEWSIRAKSFEKLRSYLGHAKPQTTILDLGCGNGWAAARLAENQNLILYALDVNRPELEQADRVFSKPNLRYYFGDIFEDLFAPESFQHVLMNACLQYFPDIDALFERIFFYLKPGGELHIIDTPIYERSEVAGARKRSLEYYQRLGFPEMAGNYFHHSWQDLKKYHPQRMDRRSLLSLLLQKKRRGSLTCIKIKKR